MSGLGSLSYSLGAGSKIDEQYIRAIKASYGTSIDTDQPVREVEIIALAKMVGDVDQIFRRQQNETVPDTSVIGLVDWAKRLGVKVLPDDSDQDTRNACAAKYRASAGNNLTAIYNALDSLLGEYLIELNIVDGVLAQAETFWAGVNPGNPLIDLGGDAVGQWSSARSHLLIVVSPIPGKSIEQLQQILDTKMFNILDVMLPSWVTWDYQISLTNYHGFDLDDDSLDITSL